MSIRRAEAPLWQPVIRPSDTQTCSIDPGWDGWHRNLAHPVCGTTLALRRADSCSNRPASGNFGRLEHPYRHPCRFRTGRSALTRGVAGDTRCGGRLLMRSTCCGPSHVVRSALRTPISVPPSYRMSWLLGPMNTRCCGLHPIEDIQLIATSAMPGAAGDERSSAPVCRPCALSLPPLRGPVERSRMRSRRSASRRRRSLRASAIWSSRSAIRSATVSPASTSGTTANSSCGRYFGRIGRVPARACSRKHRYLGLS